MSYRPTEDMPDLTGRVFGKLRVIGKSPDRPRSDYLWICECACGRQVSVRQFNLLHGKSKSCGCSKYADHTGERRGYLTAVRSTGERSPGNRIIWEWRCDCGNTVYGHLGQIGGRNRNMCEMCQMYLRTNKTHFTGRNAPPVISAEAHAEPTMDAKDLVPIKRARIRAGFTQVQLAALVGVKSWTICRWENGDSNPPADVLYKMANALNVPEESLIR